MKELREKLEDAIEQKDSLAKIAAEEQPQADTFDAPSTDGLAPVQDLGVVGKVRRSETEEPEKTGKTE
jgi:hypothetical protein